MSTAAGERNVSRWSWLEALNDVGEQLDVGSTAERVADRLRLGITEGHLPPGSQLSEQQLSVALGVSRNTLREAFRLLTHEGLLVHRPHRGVFVPELDEEDVAALYELRRIVEVQVVRSLPPLEAEDLALLWRDIEEAEEAALSHRWGDVGSANMHLHLHLVALLGNPKIVEMSRRLFAELRLAFHATSQQELFETFLPRNRELVRLLGAGEMDAAARALEQYLIDSQAQLVEAFRRSPAEPHMLG